MSFMDIPFIIQVTNDDTHTSFHCMKYMIKFVAVSVCGQRLWSPAAYRNTTWAFPRLAEFRCHLVRRGVAAASFHPGSCWSTREIN